MADAPVFCDDSKFYSNERCVLHVWSQYPNVDGNGQWATLPNGIMFARMLRDGRYYCRVCAEDPDKPRHEACQPR